MKGSQDGGRGRRGGEFGGERGEERAEGLTGGGKDAGRARRGKERQEDRGGKGGVEAKEIVVGEEPRGGEFAICQGLAKECSPDRIPGGEVGPKVDLLEEAIQGEVPAKGLDQERADTGGVFASGMAFQKPLRFEKKGGRTEALEAEK